MDALPDTHVGITVNDIDISRQRTWDEIDGLPEVRGRLAAERNELVAMGLPVITGNEMRVTADKQQTRGVRNQCQHGIAVLPASTTVSTRKTHASHQGTGQCQCKRQ